MNRVARFRLIGFAIAAAIFVVDQIVKWAVAGPLRLLEQGDSLEILPIFALTRTHNYGVSLGLFSAYSTEMQLVLIVVTGLIALAVALWMMREKLRGDILALSLVLGGALGNIVDRVRLGYVLDYADLHFGDFRPFLVFNVADAAITIGVLIVLARALFMREKPDETQGQPKDSAPVQDTAETH